MLRRDARNTGVSPLKGNLKRPRIAWSHPVKGLTPLPHFIDVDGDGKKEALSGHGGNFSAYRLDGSLLWRQRMENTSVYAAGDLDEDGERELLVASGVPSQVKVLRARDGKVLYTCELFPKAGVGGIRVAKLDPQKKGLQAVVWSTQHEIGFCLSFADGVKNAKVDWTFDWKVTNFSPEVALADMDRDGVLDVVVVTYGHVFVFDGRSGRTKVDMEWHAGRNYGTLVVKDVNADGYPDVVILSDQLREHVAAIQNEAGKSLRLLWDTFYEQNYPEDKKSLRVLSESVDDFDGDGRTEIVYAVCDETTDGKWHTLVVDALTGSVKRNLLGYLVGAGALFPNQPPVLFLSQPSSRTELSLNRVSVWSGQNGPWREQATLPTGTLLPLRSARDFEPFAWSLSQVPTTVIRNFGSQRGVFLSGEKNVEFLTGDVAGKIATRWRWEQSSEGNVVGVEEVVPDAGKPQVLLASKDDVLRIVGSNGKTFGEVKPVGFVTSPVVARLRKENAPSILFFDAKGSLCCVRVSDGKSQLLWSQPASGSHGAPVVVDLDGDGEKEILVAQTPNKLVALDALGSVKRSWQFPSLPFQWTFGNFDGDDALDLFVTYKLGLFVDVESVAVSGKTGKVLWRAHCGNNGPPAVCDADGDGIDDVILRDLFERRVLNGRTGRDIYPIIQWAGYHAPILVPMNGAKKPPAIVWVGGSYSMLADTMEGEQLWWKPFRATGHQAVADVDGDGRLEVGGVTAGQLYNWPQFYAVDGPNKEFMCYDALTGEVKWSFPLGVTASGVVAADLDGDGKMEFLLGTADGRLMALRGGKAAERKLWELTFPAALGTPIVCAANGDGKMEILVSCADGNLYCVSSESF
jgi:outer membrane protein assembly factor BamB